MVTTTYKLLLNLWNSNNQCFNCIRKQSLYNHFADQPMLANTSS